MRVLIMGGDGYLGWPTAMHLADAGHDVLVCDNYLRRTLARQLDVEPLVDPPNLVQRAAAWREQGGKPIEVAIGDLAEWGFVEDLFARATPQAIVHYAEQPSAPYSMLDRRAAALTLHNNLGVTLNLIHAVHRFCPGSHIVKLGTMGEYGTPNIDIEEGWIDVDHKGRRDRFLFPRQAGSLYHTTKIMDTDLLWFYVRVWNLCVTDLMQGPVYGVETEESARDADRLSPHLSYDEIFGTVLNRFVVQAVAGIPLTIYGSGGQTRGYLDLRDTIQCIRLVVEQPPAPGELRILNQFVETFSVRDLAQRVQTVARRLGLAAEVAHVPNPRKEKEEHYYNPASTGLLDLGLKPHRLSDDGIARMIELVRRHHERIEPSRIVRNVRWD
jgi:UDP-sulfoquinovose synthase